MADITKKRITYKPFEYPQAYDFWLTQQQSHWLHCVAKDQLVVTSQGLITVGELYKKNCNLVLFNNNTEVKSSPMLKTAYKQLYKINTKEGLSHSVTEDHRVMTSDGWKEAKDLIEGDKLIIQTNEGLFGKVHEPELAYLAGHFQGDGTSNKNTLFFQVWEKDWGTFIPKIEECIKKVYQKHNLDSERYNIPTFGTINNNSGRMPMKRLTTMKLGKFNLSKNTIPDFVLKGDKETVLSYLEGLFDTDGTCFQDKKHESIKISQINKKFIETLQILLLNFGIKSSVYKREGCKRLMPDSKGGEKYYSCKDLYTLEISHKKSVIKLDKFINIFEKRCKKLRGFLNEKKSHPITYARFTKLEKLEKDDVFCVSVDSEDHAWVCNGFITHNTEISLNEDVVDFEHNLTDSERNVIANVLKLFTQTEINVEDYWSNYITKWFPKPEIVMMASTFAAFESIHIASYSYLNDSLGLDDYEAFLKEPSMKAKIDRLVEIPLTSNKKDIARSLAVFSAFVEGVALFSSFAILMNFSRTGKLKGMKDIVTYSCKDESIHSAGGTYLFQELIRENPEIFTDDLKKDIYDAARITVEQEDHYIDKVFELGPIDGLDPDDLKEYIRYRANTKLGDLGMKMNWKNLDFEKINRLNWFDFLVRAENQSDFFTRRVTDYAKGNIDFSNIKW